MKKKVVFQNENKFFRIVQVLDSYIDMESLKGDCYCPKVNSDIAPEELSKQELAFENKVEDEGVYGFILEKWDPSPGMGWENLDSVWGYVGEYNPNDKEYNHDIVEEFKEKIKDLNK